MKLFSRLRMTAALAVVLIFIGANAGAQALTFGLGVTNSAGDNSTGSLLVNNSLTYAISVTNLIDLVPTALISNVLPASVEFLSATNSQGSVTSYGSVIVFDLGPFGAGQTAQLSLTVQPTVAGFITNAISVNVTNLILFPVTTNIVTLITNLVPTEADLGVALTGPAQTVIVNDLMTYGVTVTNLGPDDVPDVQLTNTLPPGVILKSVSPTNQPFSIVTNNLIFDLGPLTAGSGTNLQFTIQPTNAGVLNFSAAIGVAGIVDSNPTNDVAGTNINVINYLSLPLFVVTNSAQTPNLANGSDGTVHPGVEQCRDERHGCSGGRDQSIKTVIQRLRHQQWESVRRPQHDVTGRAGCEPAAAIRPARFVSAGQFPVAGVRRAAAQFDATRGIVQQRQPQHQPHCPLDRRHHAR